MPLTPQQEMEIYPLLDAALELQVGKAVLHNCTRQRANYLTRVIQGLRYNLAIESMITYDTTSPFYGLGVYANIWAEAHDRGLLITTLAKPTETIMWKIIRCRATQKPQRLETSKAAANQCLLRAKKRHPKLMGSLWLTTDPLTVYCAKKEKEQIIVDIDIDPAGEIKSPTQEDEAKAQT